MVVDEFARRLGIDRWKVKDGARQAYDSARGLVLVEPQTYMNNSGVPLRIIASWYRVAPEDILVVYDEMDIPFGRLRLRAAGGHGGHNGMRSIIATMGDRFARLRIGVGRPEYDSIDHVLAPFSAEQQQLVPKIVEAATDGVACWFERGIEAAMQFANTWEHTEPETNDRE
jgi:PTH1 family peptidyl-tRNA hydrolase